MTNFHIFWYLKLLIFYGIVFFFHSIFCECYSFYFILDSFKISYLLNFLFTFLSVLILLFFTNKKVEYLAFIFFLISGLKFLVFFKILYPVFKSDGEIKNDEILTFFIPYSLGLIFEILIVENKLKKKNYN